MTQHRLALPLLVITGASLAACSSGGSGGGTQETGTLSVSLMDAPVEGVTEVHVEIAGLSVKPINGPAIELDIGTETVTVDLLELTEENAALLVDGETLPAGEYEWLRMAVNAEHDGEMDSYVMTALGGQVELRVPSGTVRLVSGFEILGGQELEFLIDWSVRQGLVDPIGLDGYLLKPAFRVLRIDESSTLSGMVDALTLQDESCANDDEEDIAAGNVVYVYEGHDVTPFDFDGEDPEPFATADVELDMNGDYVYSVSLMPGDYTVAFTCEAANDLPESAEDIVFLGETNATMDADGEIVDF